MLRKDFRIQFTYTESKTKLRRQETLGLVFPAPKISSCLRDYFHPGFGLRPRRRRELFDLTDLRGWQTREQIFQIIKRIDTVPATTAQQCVNHRAALSGFRMANK